MKVTAKPNANATGACQRGGAVLPLLVGRFDDDPHSLVLPEIQLTGWLENAVRIDGLGDLRHGQPIVPDQNGAERVDPAGTPGSAERTGAGV